MEHRAHRASPPVRCRCLIVLALASAAGTAAMPHPADAQVRQTVLYSFSGAQDGATPSGALLVDTSGFFGTLRGLYTTTIEGGTTTLCTPGCGSVFKLQPPHYHQTTWTGASLWDFTGGGDGDTPLGGVSALFPLVTSQTPLFGTTSGANVGNGTVFSLTGHTLTTLYTFTGGADGAFPTANVVTDWTGALYTTTVGFTANGTGTAIRLAPPRWGQTAWTETTLWVFSGGNDGGGPYGLTIGQDGGVYGTTAFGGLVGGGTVFRLVPPTPGQPAWGLQTLWNFGNPGDGQSPLTALTVNRDGTLYGTTSGGGGSGSGTVFAVYPPHRGQTSWTEQVLYSFTGGSDGAAPLAPLILDRTGAIFGTASAGGGALGAGSVFKLAPPARGQTAWTETTLWAFSGPDGYNPVSSLAADRSGTLYGTTEFGGAGGPQCHALGPSSGCGVVFSLTGTGFLPW